MQEFLGFRAPSFAFVTGFVYFVEVAPDGPVKIGIADDPDRRLATLQNAHHEELRIVAVLPGDRWFERALHGRFLAGRIRGEWYRRDTPGLELMLDLAATAEGHFLETGKWTLDPAELGWDPQGAA